MVNGIFGAVKTEEQLRREEKYKQDLRNQIDEKQQRAAEEAARRRTEEERELAKQLEWQQLMERQKADEASRRHDIDTQEQYDQQRLHDELERQRQHDEMNARQSLILVASSFSVERVFLSLLSKTPRNKKDREHQFRLITVPTGHGSGRPIEVHHLRYPRNGTRSNQTSRRKAEQDIIHLMRRMRMTMSLNLLVHSHDHQRGPSRS